MAIIKKAKDIQKDAKEFAAYWKDKGYEKGESQVFWVELLGKVFGVADVTHFIEFEDQVHIDKSTGFIDGYIPKTKVLIEQKSIDKDLRKPIRQSDGSMLNPFQQAKKYIAELPVSKHPKWVITCNFKEFLIYDMENPNGEPESILLENLPKEYYRLGFLVDTGDENIKREEEISIKAGEIVGKLYDALSKQYADPNDEESQKSLNVLCVRLVFCFYAEDADVFGKHLMFHDYLNQVDARHFRSALIELFKVLNTPIEKRDKYLDEDLAAFPYVNGGLFADDSIEIPQFTEEIRTLILQNASEDFDWSEISPTIFGAVFESTLNPETRRSGGIHYTSVENIHKVIDPLFLDDLKAELEEIKELKQIKTKNEKLEQFCDKLAGLKFLDPACGSGNFLTETYLSLRKLENEAIGIIQQDQIVMGEFSKPIKVKISQFYGIEINDFAVTVAKTALWIAESQMMKKTEEIIHQNIDFLPLTTNAYIVDGNALRMDWNDVIPANELTYIMGNPPFVGYSLQNKTQKEDILSIYIDEQGRPYKTAGKIDYVAGWYWKASQMMVGNNIRTALVSTNSITQGEQVASVWKPLFARFNIHIDFAYKTFRWDSEASIKAHVHCVIIGFSSAENEAKKRLYETGRMQEVDNINAYLVNAPSIFVDTRSRPVSDVPAMTTGNRPADGGHLIIESCEYDEFVKNEPNAIKYIKKLIGAQEFINNKDRFCLWLVGVSPSEIRKMPYVLQRVELCKQDRLNGAPDRQKLAATPTVFRETKNPKSYIVVPASSSENRRYIPMGFLDENTIPTNLAVIIPGATVYHFGVLTSNVHMAWMRAVAGRLKSDYRYSKDIVYNNFPWPTPTDEQKAKIEQTAQAILDARAKYSDCTLADLYDDNVMPSELRKAHDENDVAVKKAYGFKKDITEKEIVAALMKMYQKLTQNN